MFNPYLLIVLQFCFLLPFLLSFPSSFIYSLNIFFEHLLCVRHHTELNKYRREYNSWASFADRAFGLLGRKRVSKETSKTDIWT